MFFLLRMAFWLSVVMVLLPSGGSQPRTGTAPSAELGAMETLSAASATVSDMRRFCSRQPEACAVGSQAAVAIGQRAQAGAKMVFDFFNERAAPRETGSITARPRQVAAQVGPAAKSQDTLTAADLVPAWRGSHRESHNKPGA